ncbi:hypothetical protein B0H10DRAFT_2434234 [Mycena sp. CBHHK59/15]|nr:hypothetical protein B0H10DRAFT_2434234 [Mycena sp. CBHHK59/15]
MATDGRAGAKHTPADREYIDSLSARQLMEFRNYVYSPMYIAANAAKFLDHEWADMAALREFLQQQAQNSTTGASTTRASTITDTIRIKIEATPSSAVKAEPQIARVPPASAEIKMRTLNDGGREIFELLSDSDLEVIEALQRDSRSSSVIPLAAPSDHLPDDDSDSAEPDIYSTASNDGDDSGLVESDTAWHDDTTSFVRIEKFRPTQKVTVEHMEYRDGLAAVYPIHHIRTGIVVDLNDQRYWFHASTTKEPHSLNTIIIDADNDGWEWTGSSNWGAQVTFAPGEDPVDCRRVRYDCTPPFGS